LIHVTPAHGRRLTTQPAVRFDKSMSDVEQIKPSDLQWTQCPLCHEPMPANEAATYGAHEDCKLGVRQPATGERPRRVGSRPGIHVMRKATNEQ
jgi:hypothetical protein